MGDEADFYRFMLDQFGCALRVCMPGIIQSFDPVKQTVVVQPAIIENMIQKTPDGLGGVVPVPTPTKIKPLQDVPIVLPRGGGFTVTLPIAPGDECIIVFADACINAWWAQGDVQPQEVNRRHDLCDGFAILGTWSQPRVLSGYVTNAAQLRTDDGNTAVSVAAGQINMKATNVVVEGALTVTGDATINTAAVPLDLGIHVHTGGTIGGLTGPPET